MCDICDHQPDGYRVDIVINGALERAESYNDYLAALARAEEHYDALSAEPNITDWQITIYDEAPYPPELTDEWTA